MPADHVTLRQVADHAGVSLATASRALGRGGPVAAGTRAKVLATAAELDYRGDPRTQRPRTMLGVVGPGLDHEGIAATVAGVDEVSADAGAYCALAVSRGDPERELAQLWGMADDDRIGCVVVVGGITLTEAYVRRLARIARRMRSLRKPLILCGRAVAGPRELSLPGLVVLEYDNVGGSATAVDLLVSHGHRAIGMVRGPVGHSVSDARTFGYRSALERLGLPYRATRIRCGPRNADDGYRAARELLTADPSVTAIFAENDSIATGVLKAAHDIGRSVPGELSLVGFDDRDGAEFTVPALTTIHMPFDELGRVAAGIALRTTPTGPVAGRMMVPTHMVIRETVAAPPAR